MRQQFLDKDSVKRYWSWFAQLHDEIDFLINQFHRNTKIQCFFLNVAAKQLKCVSMW